MSEIFLYNTLTRQKEKFVPLDDKNIRMYVCGPTVYDFAHIGNARPVVVFDTLYRLLKRYYPRVTYARNITDVDDKIIQKAKTSGEAIQDLTHQTILAYHDDMKSLNALTPDIEPRCTEHIPQMIALIETLMVKGFAYAAENHVLFHVPAMPNYGELSRHSHDTLIAGARVDVAPYKKDPTDFILWKPSTPDQPGWESPWGRGRPGWHIECSAMAKEHLGITFDIHGGGLDLIFPHHENEIAQSRSAHDGKKFANLWMHNGFLTIDSEKMSKSLGNFKTVHELRKHYPGEVIRLALLGAHYRQPLDFSSRTLLEAKGNLDRWYGALRSASGDVVTSKPPALFEAALLDDLNTPNALAQIHEIASRLNKKGSDLDTVQAKSELRAAGEALGILQQNPEKWFQGEGGENNGPSEKEISELIVARLAARKSKDFKEADRIRDYLLGQGIALEDGAGNTSWRRV